MPPRFPHSVASRVVVCAMMHAAYLEASIALPLVQEVGVSAALESYRAFASNLASQTMEGARHDLKL